MVFSLGSGIIWDNRLANRVKNEIQSLQSSGVPWLILSSDGADMEGSAYVAAHFDYQPTLTPDRGRRQIIQTAGTIVVVNMGSYRSLGCKPVMSGELGRLVNDLILLGYARGLGSYFTGALFPCLIGHSYLNYQPVDERLASSNVRAFLVSADADALFPLGVDRRVLVAAWFETINLACRKTHRISFVIRTLFRRAHLLERCLISIEYIRVSTGFPAEIVIATDVEPAITASEVEKLSDCFPHLSFVVADGRSEPGHSRVRNLVAGLKATTGTRVCIIDDDDFYTPQAVAHFEQACAFGKDDLVIFDCQIVLERWLHHGVKPHRELLEYRNLFRASDWAITLRGSNSIPLCGIVHPGWFVRQVAYEYKFDFDLSEDFIFHLYCFAHPKRPSVVTLEGIGAYQSHRENHDNVSSVEDRTQWIADTGNGLYQLLFEENRSFEIVSSAEGKGEREVRDVLRAELDLAQVRADQATGALADLVERLNSRGDVLRAELDLAQVRADQATGALADLVERLDSRAVQAARARGRQSYPRALLRWRLPPSIINIIKRSAKS